ncbi:MAG: hypothetical protein C0591_10650 [Marinilabiliales bacterium]|nr:MAG: hypothetical protein C0591_10650 [Marinilabiliales bacterium]
MMKASGKYMDFEYHFKGKWDLPGICGLKVVEKPKKTIVIATNLYEHNPGTSISRWSAQLAAAISKDLKVDPSKLIFIEYNPDLQSKLEFYKETFDIVEFDRDGNLFTNPRWKRISKKEVDDMIS